MIFELINNECMKNVINFLRTSIIITCLFLVGSCQKKDETLNPTPTARGKLGLQPTPQGLLQAIPIAASIDFAGAVPSSFSLETPPPHAVGQGQEGSCVGWAVAYGTSSYHFGKSYFNSDGSINYKYIGSPEYLYNQIKVSDCESGSYFVDNQGNKGALDELVRQGVSSWEMMPYSNGDCSTQPNSSQRQDAQANKIRKYERISNFDVRNLKVLLLSKFPIIIGATVDDGFMNSTRNTIWKSKVGAVRGNHAMVVTGYDDNRNAFRLLNSWGTSWGDGGYGWLDYSYFSNVVFEAYITYPNGNTPPPQNETRILQLSGNLNFGNVNVGQNSVKTLTITNIGNSPLTVSSLTLPAGFSGNFSGIIAANNSQTINITFTPNTATTFSGLLVVNSNYTSGANTFDMTGTGVQNQPTDDLTKGLVLYLPFSGNANDASGTNHGTVNGATLTKDRNENANSAYSFNGINNFIEIPNSTTLNPNQISICAWIKTNQLGGVILAKADNNGEQYDISMNGWNGIHGAIKQNSNCISGIGWHVNSANTKIEDGTWHYVVSTFDGIDMKIYIDGKLKNTKFNLPQNNIDNCGTKLTIGAFNGIFHFLGSIDEIRIYNRALTDQEIVRLHKQ